MWKSKLAWIRLALVPGVVLLSAVARADDAPPASLPNTPVVGAGSEHFMAHVTPIECEGTIQMIRSVEVSGNDIRVRQVARWSDADSVGFSSIADLVIDHFDDSVQRRISLDELRSTLSGAGVNLSKVRFAGNTSCLVTRGTVPEIKPPADDREVVQQWIEQKNKPDAAEAPAPVKAAAELKPDVAGDSADAQYHTLREVILADLAQRLNLPSDDLQVTFDQKDRSFLNLTEPMFQFQLEPRRLADLGKVSWDATIIDGKTQRKLTINAEARCWEKQLVVARAISYRQVLRDDDFIERRRLVDHVEYDPLLTRRQIVGQQAARDLKPETVLTARMLEPIPLVRQGDVVDVTLCTGGIQIRVAATAMESGCYGQSIRVRNEENKSIYVVTVTDSKTGVVGGKGGAAEAKDDAVAAAGK
jgi:flagella basal body P-ring formation protein FlgA